MDLTGRIQGVSRDFMTRKPMIQFLLNEEPNGIETLEGDLVIKVTKKTKPRSLDSNAYFHVLCDKLRQKLNLSMARMKNILITSYGQIEYIEEGQALVYKTNASPEYIEELEEAHLKFLKKGDDGGYWYKVYRGSHTYNTAEMAKLIEGTIAEAKEQGIETATPAQLERMQELWNQKQSRYTED